MPGTIGDLKDAGARIRQAQARAQQAAKDVAASLTPKPDQGSPAAPQDHERK